MSFKLLKYIILVFFTVLVIPKELLANEIKVIRAFESNEKTRIVFDMAQLPKYQVGLAANKLSYEVRIKEIDNPRKKLAKIAIKKNSVINGVKRGMRTNEVVYIFSLKKKVTPVTFALKANNSAGPRLVIDFPNNTKQEISNLAQNDRQVTKEVSNINELEAALFDDLNSESDSKTPAANVESRLAAPEPPKPTHNKKKNLHTYRIVIDPGHGGKDPGALGKRGLKEKVVTFGVSKALVDYINSDPNMRGYLTRTRDKFIELGERSEIARKYKADLLISIHADSAANSRAQGASILVLSNQRANRENSKLEKNKHKQKELLSGAGEVISGNANNNPYFASMILDLTSDHARTEGYKLAQEILKSMGKSIHLHRSSPIHRSLAVLKAPDIPSLLIETGFLSNADEERLLRTAKYQREVAYLIYKGLKEYVRKNPILIKEDIQEGNAVYYLAKKGDSLSKIAQMHGLSVNELKRLNNLKSNIVRIGQRFLVKEAQ